MSHEFIRPKNRHRGQFNHVNDAPYEVSRSKVENHVRCRACFSLERREGIKFPRWPPFNLNSNTDKLLKKDLDRYRGKGPHPVMTSNGLGHLQPFHHPDMERWQDSLHFGASPSHFNTVHKETNLLFGGGLDDVWINTDTNLLHVVDYKSTSNQSKNPQPPSLKGPWKEGYKRQMEMYQWILRRKGFDVSDVSYFLYVDGLHKDIDGMINSDPAHATMQFATSILEYSGDDAWVEPELFAVKKTLMDGKILVHAKDCEYGNFIESLDSVRSRSMRQGSVPLALEPSAEATALSH